MAPVIRDPGGLEGEVKNVGECRGYVVTLGFTGDKHIKPLNFGRMDCYMLKAIYFANQFRIEK